MQKNKIILNLPAVAMFLEQLGAVEIEYVPI